MTWRKTFLSVTVGALIGMVLGGLFGLAAGAIAPAFFAHIIPWSDVEPIGIATVFGAIAGVLMGGGLATVAIILQVVVNRRRGGDENAV